MPATLDAASVRRAYARQASLYDLAFGLVSRGARARAVAAVNAEAGTRVLEVGVGTGLSLPHYRREKRIVGIDLSRDMLARAWARVARDGLSHVEALLEADASALPFAPHGFDLAVGMFVASVVPDPRRMMAELRRVVRPGGVLIFVNHFAASSGLRLAIERAATPFASLLGWHPDFTLDRLLTAEERRRAVLSPAAAGDFFSLLTLRV